MPYRIPDRGPVRVRTSITAAESPTTNELEEGELALNSNDGRLFYQTSANAISAFPSATGITRIVAMTTAAYNAITPDPNTLYVLT